MEVDEFVIGGQHPSKRGRETDGKTIVVAAVEKKGKNLAASACKWCGIALAVF